MFSGDDLEIRAICSHLLVGYSRVGLLVSHWVAVPLVYHHGYHFVCSIGMVDRSWVLELQGSLQLLAKVDSN
ncbi:hypothetical protein CWRG_00546 [Chthonomonas calidirosea]|nr:hypothetical protein CWRG_00546 [Chthonomonas calidirosea]